jgi:hypothetical protein
MGKKNHKTTVLNPPTSVLELAKEVDAETANYIDFLFMEINANQAILAEERARLKKKLPYDEVLSLISQIGLRCSMLAHYCQKLDEAFDKIMELAPDVEE